MRLTRLPRTRLPRPSRRALLAATVALLALATTAAAQGPQGANPDEGVLVRVDGDATVPAGERVGVVVVVGGNATVTGEVGTLVLVNGTATLGGGGTAGTLVVVDGVARLESGSVVTGDVRLVDATLSRADGATVNGDIVTGWDARAAASFFLVVGAILTVGLTIVVLLAGLLAAAVAPRQVRKAGAAITQDLGPSVLGALLAWIALPILAIIAFATVVGIPLGFAIFAIVLPLLWLIGYLVAGIRLGEAIVYRNRPGGAPAHPYVAALVGLLILQVVSWVPYVGAILAFIAGFVGAGGVVLVAWRSATRERRDARAQPAGASPP